MIFRNREKECVVFNEILAEVAIKYNVDADLMERFTYTFLHHLRMDLMNKKSFHLYGWGDFEFPKEFSDERSKEKKRIRGLKADKNYHKRKAERKKLAYKLLIKRLHKQTRRLDFILSLYN